MATTHIDLNSQMTGILTTDHPASSYNQPVLVVEGIAYGPNDRLPLGEFAAEFGFDTAIDVVRAMAELNCRKIAKLPSDQYNLIAKFVRDDANWPANKKAN